MVREILTVLMDGIKDANMLADYAHESEETEHKVWFLNHAKRRYEDLVSDYAFVKVNIGIEQKAREGDAIAEALAGHIEHEIADIKRKIDEA